MLNSYKHININFLRDLPQCGNTQWQSYFGRTFDLYTRLWKYQQQNRFCYCNRKERYFRKSNIYKWINNLL